MQRLNENATSFLKGKTDAYSSSYVGSWEQVRINDGVMAVYAEDKKQNRLHIEYNNGSRQVIDLDVQGVVGKDELIRLTISG
jgi:hypothetical protein